MMFILLVPRCVCEAMIGVMVMFGGARDALNCGT
jgi:hypothetical protein